MAWTKNNLNTGDTITNDAVDNWDDGIEDIYNGDGLYVVTTGSANTYVATFTTAYTAYTTGLTLRVNFNVSCTGTSTINVDTLGAKTIKVIGSSGKADVKTGDIISGGVYLLVYDGTDFILTSANALLQSTVTAQGDILYASAANTITRLGKGTAYQSLRMNSGATAPEWGVTTASGLFTDTTTSLPGVSYTNISIPLGFSATHGIAFLNSSASQDGICCNMRVSSGSSQGMEAQGGNVTYSTLPTASFNALFGTSINLNDIYISGTNMVVRLFNTGAPSQTANLFVTWEAWI